MIINHGKSNHKSKPLLTSEKLVLIFLSNSAAMVDKAIAGQELTQSFSKSCHTIWSDISYLEKYPKLQHKDKYWGKSVIGNKCKRKKSRAKSGILVLPFLELSCMTPQLPPRNTRCWQKSNYVSFAIHTVHHQFVHQLSYSTPTWESMSEPYFQSWFLEKFCFSRKSVTYWIGNLNGRGTSYEGKGKITRLVSKNKNKCREIRSQSEIMVKEGKDTVRQIKRNFEMVCILFTLRDREAKNIVGSWTSGNTFLAKYFTVDTSPLPVLALKCENPH